MKKRGISNKLSKYVKNVESHINISKVKPELKWAVNLLRKIIKGDYSDELDGPAIWLGSVKADMNVSPYYIWKLDKENMIFNTPKHDVRYHGKLHHYEIITPEGKVVTPLRQFCNHIVLKPEQHEATFFSISSVPHSTISYGVDWTIPNTYGTEQIRTEPRITGTKVSILMSHLDNVEPRELIASTNKSFCLESLTDENKSIIDTLDRYPKENVNKISYDIVMKRINNILEKGFNPKDIILLLTGKAIINLYDDPKIRERIEYSKLRRGLSLLEGILGVKIIRGGSACVDRPYNFIEFKSETYWQRFIRVLLFRKLPIHTVEKKLDIAVLFTKESTGLVTSQHVTMEAARKSEIQAVNIQGLHRVASVELAHDSIEVIHYVSKTSGCLV